MSCFIEWKVTYFDRPFLYCCTNFFIADRRAFSRSKPAFRSSVFVNLFVMSSSMLLIFTWAYFNSFTILSSRDFTFSKSAFICSFWTRSLAAVVSESSSWPYLNFRSLRISSTICYVGSLFCLAIVFYMCSNNEAMCNWLSPISDSSSFFSISNFSENSFISFSFWYRISYFCSSFSVDLFPLKSLSNSFKFC